MLSKNVNKLSEREKILTKLSDSVGGSEKDLFTSKELDAFAEHYLKEEKTINDVVSSFLSYWWETPCLCRRCSICGRLMTTGYCYNFGQMYFCSDKCLHAHFSDEEWREECQENDQSYYTEWR